MRMQSPWSLTFELQSQFIFETGENLSLHFSDMVLLNGWSEPNASTRQLQALRRNRVTDENIALSAIHTFFTFHRVAVMKELIVSWQFDCAENAVAFHFHFYYCEQTLLLIIIVMLLNLGKREVVLFRWFVEHKENASLQGYVFWELKKAKL